MVQYISMHTQRRKVVMLSKCKGSMFCQHYLITLILLYLFIQRTKWKSAERQIMYTRSFVRAVVQRTLAKQGEHLEQDLKNTRSLRPSQPDGLPGNKTESATVEHKSAITDKKQLHH